MYEIDLNDTHTHTHTHTCTCMHWFEIFSLLVFLYLMIKCTFQFFFVLFKLWKKTPLKCIGIEKEYHFFFQFKNGIYVRQVFRE